MKTKYKNEEHGNNAKNKKSEEAGIMKSAFFGLVGLGRKKIWKIISPAFLLSTILVLVLTITSPVFAASSGPNNAGTGTDVSGVGSVTWSNTSRIKTPSSGGATANVSTSTTTHYLEGTSYGFAIPTGATINGITVVINRQSTGSSSPFIQDYVVSLIKGGNVQSTNKAVTGTNWPTSGLTTATYGGASDLWRNTWTSADINATNFGVALSVTNPNTNYSRTATVDYMQITVTYTVSSPPTVTSVSPNSGSTAGGTPVTITGTNFISGATVTFGSTAATNVILVNSTTITANTPSGTAGATNVSVTTSAGTGTDTSGYTYLGAAAKLAFVQQPSNTAAGSSISPAVTVSVEDAGGNVVTSSTASITIAIGTNPGSGTLSGTTSVSAVSGVATFSNLSINTTGTGYTLSATSTGLTGDRQDLPTTDRSGDGTGQGKKREYHNVIKNSGQDNYGIWCNRKTKAARPNRVINFRVIV